MHSSTKEKFEEILQSALTLYERGVSVPEIVKTFPDYGAELGEIFGVVDMLAVERNRINPPQTALSKCLERLGERDVPEPEWKQRKPLHFSGVFLRFGAPIVLVAGILFAFVVRLAPTVTPQPLLTQQNPRSEPSVTTPIDTPADAIVNAVLTDAQDDQADFMQESTHSSLLTSDSTDLVNLSQFYDESKI